MKIKLKYIFSFLLFLTLIFPITWFSYFAPTVKYDEYVINKNQEPTVTQLYLMKKFKKLYKWEMKEVYWDLPKDEFCIQEKQEFETKKQENLNKLEDELKETKTNEWKTKKLIESNKDWKVNDLTIVLQKLTNKKTNIEKNIENEKSKTFVCSFDTKKHTNGNLIIALLQSKSLYNIIMANWGQWVYKKAFENVFIKRQEEFARFLSWKNQEEQKTFLENCSSWDKRLTIRKWLYIGLDEKDQENIIKCVLLRNADTLTIKWQINTTFKEARQTNIWIWLSSLNWIWKQWELLSVMEKTQTKKWYVDGLALFVDEKDKTKVVAKPVPQGWICWVSTILYQTVLGAYQNFWIEQRSPHLQFYKEYYNFDGIDASLYGENWVVYKDLKLKNNSPWPLLVLTSTTSEKQLNKFHYYVTIWSLYNFQKSFIEYGKRYKSWTNTCITNTIKGLKNKENLTTISSCYKDMF